MATELKKVWHGYEPRRVPTATLDIGDLVWYPGAGCLAPVVAVERNDLETALTVAYEVWGRRRRAIVRRKTGGKSIVHVSVGGA